MVCLFVLKKLLFYCIINKYNKLKYKNGIKRKSFTYL